MQKRPTKKNARGAGLCNPMEQLHKIAEHVPGVVYQFQLWPDGHSAFPYASPGIRDIYGVDPEQVRDDSSAVFAVLHPYDLDGIVESIRESADNLTVWHCKYRVLRGAGRVLWVEGEASPERLDDGSVIWHGYIRDITEQHLAEEAIRISEQRLKHALWGTDAGTWEWNVQTGEVYFNERWAEIIGYRLEDLQPITIATWQNFAHPEDLKRSEQALRRHFGGETAAYECEVRMRHKDGHWVWVLDRGKVVERTPGGDPKLMFGTHVDVSRQRQTYRRLELLLETATDGLHMLDADGNVVECSQSFARMLGYSWEEAQDLNLIDWEAMLPRHEVPTVIHDLLVHPQLFESLHRRKDGSTFPVEINAGPVTIDDTTYLYASSRDISERKQAEQALRETNQQYAAVIASNRDGFILMDAEGRILDVNQNLCALTGFRDAELRAMQLADLQQDEPPATIRQRLAHLVQARSALFEAAFVRRDGSTCPVELSMSYAPLQGGLCFAFVRDIRERKVDEYLADLRHTLSELVYTSNEDLALQKAVDAAEYLTDSQIGFFHYIEPDQETISLAVWSTNTIDKMCGASGSPGHYPVSEAGVWVDCIRKRHPVVHNDYAALPHRQGLPPGHAPITRELTVPIFRDKRLVAIIGVGNKARDYDEADISLVGRAADIAFDFFERQRAEQKIQFMAFNDVLTGIPNRELFADRLKQAMSVARRAERLLAVCYLDLDGFKPINDDYGHEVGDQLLIEFADRMQRRLRSGDTLARLGGDEFAILLNDLDSIARGEAILERILRSVGEPFLVGGQRLVVTASIGITVFPHDDEDTDTLLRHADQAMYKAKEIGKNTLVFYDPIADHKRHVHRSAVSEFEAGLRNGQLVLHYQPRIDLRTAEVAGAEALVRWQRPGKGLVYPGDFLGLIKETALEIALDDWVLQAALAQHMRWRREGRLLPVSVNLSPRHVQQESFPGYLADLLSGFPEDISRYLELEVLETGSIRDTELVSEVMHACTELGVRFSLDDFGTGYSSLTHFHRLPIAVLKIDQNFIRHMLSQPRDQDIVVGVLGLAGALQRPVVAEGVESLELGLMLLQMGCQYAQGYGIARPMPADAVSDWLAHWQGERDWHRLTDFAEGPTTHRDLNVALVSHLLCVEPIRDAIEKGDPQRRLRGRDHDCHCASWYDGMGAARYGAHERFPALLKKRDEIVDFVERVLSKDGRASPGKTAEQLETLDRISDELQGLLLQLADP
jgi:diguanylate cyclase (GGDEF)-like protein/PAS domain S-box-containing protein